MPYMTNGKRDYKWTDTGRICSKCKEYKEWSEYNWKNDKRYKNREAEVYQLKQPNCKSCVSTQGDIWRKKQSPERLRDLYLKRTYNISYSQFISMLDSQNYCCKLCNRDLDVNLGFSYLQANTAVVDHCHTTGIVRGILCNECNRGLGYFKDNIMTLQNAIVYLTEKELSSEGGLNSCHI